MSHCDQVELARVANQIVTKGKGILAADEINATMEKRFQAIDVENSAEIRRQYRKMLFDAADGTRNLSDHISGIILNHETFYQSYDGDETMAAAIQRLGIIPGIKLDCGVTPLAGTDGEFTAQGLDDLNNRCKEYRKLGARFAKWRCIYKIGASSPSQLALNANSQVLARYASICQQNGLVPIVEPEVLRDGDHDLETNQKVTEQVLSCTYKALMEHHVYLEGTLLKPNMVTAGQSCTTKYKAADIAKATVTALQRAVPCAVPGIVFLSGGQSEQEATENLNAMNKLSLKPWALSFSFARALQASALKVWRGELDNNQAAQNVLLDRACANGFATFGEYKENNSNTSGSTQSNFTPLHVY